MLINAFWWFATRSVDSSPPSYRCRDHFLPHVIERIDIHLIHLEHMYKAMFCAHLET